MEDCLEYLESNGFEGLSDSEMNAARRMLEIADSIVGELEGIK